jgi:hypothetical protein
MAASFAAFAAVQPSNASLWQTEAQLTARYGEPVDIRRPFFDKTKRIFTYQSNDLKLEVQFHDGTAQVVRYFHDDETKPFSEKEIEALLRDSSGRKTWRPVEKEKWELGVPTVAEAANAHFKQTRYLKDGTQYEVVDHQLTISRTDSPPSWSWVTSVIASCKKFLVDGERRYVGTLELKQEDGDHVVAVLRQSTIVLEIPWAAKDYPARVPLSAGKNYEVTIREENDPVDLDKPMVFVSDRIHQSHGARVVDSEGWFSLVRIRDGEVVIYDEAVCEVHHLRMTWKSADVGYGLYSPATKADAICDRQFPHHADWIRGGCIEGEEKTAFHYVCRACVAATANYKLEHPEENELLFPDEATQVSSQ